MALSDDISDQLYHVLIRVSADRKDPSNPVENVQITGTYTSLPAAKAAAHGALFKAGYEREWFNTYEAKTNIVKPFDTFEGKGLMVRAVTPDGTTFKVCIDTTLNGNRLTSELEDGRITFPLYYVIQENAEYRGGRGSGIREVNVEGVFRSYQAARDYANGVLIAEEDGLTKDSYEEYNEASPDESDCGYGENVIVRAATSNGMNYIVSVLKTQELESVRQAEAAMRMS